MRLLVSGDRHWTDGALIACWLKTFDAWPDAPPTLVHGDQHGADRLAAEAARSLGWTVEPYPADWEHYGKAAGPLRNAQMLNTGPDRVLAFHANIAQSRGTKNLVRQAQERGIPVLLITGEEEVVHDWR